jgi:polar amino acid transport system substrate-binding protein
MLSPKCTSSKSRAPRVSAELTATPRANRALAIIAGMTAAAPAQARQDHTPDAALARVLQQARATAALPGACTEPGIDRLIHILCSGRIRVGVRDHYPLFATGTGKARQGYEIDIARAIARKLGVEAEFATVQPVTRIPMLAEGRVDLVVATMGHDRQRDGQVRFIRPHYYRSETIIVGPRRRALAGWQDLRGRTVCVTVGNGSNADLLAHGARLMLFDNAGLLPRRLADQTCTLAAQDDSFFASYLADPRFAGRFSRKFGFARVPWGMAVARHGSARLARALELTSQIFHRDGVFLAFARAHHVATGFLEWQHAVWQSRACDSDSGTTNPACILPPLDARLQPTRFAGRIAAFEHWFAAHTGIGLSLPMLMTAPAWSLFASGIVNSLVLVVGTLAATLVFALGFGAALGARSRLLRWPAQALRIMLQSSPIVLTLVVAAAIADTLIPYSSTVALGAAIMALGLGNGSNAGQAIAEAMLTLRVERALSPLGGRELFSRALSRASTQIMAFLINAAKGTPIASFIGAPELLNALTDITSFSSGRVTTYSLLLIFYTAVVMIVVSLCVRFRARLERRHART